MKQSIREIVTGEVTLEYFAKRIREGWTIVGVEWARESTAAGVESEHTRVLAQEPMLPYGFRVNETGSLQENPLEIQVLLTILDQIVREKRVQEIASELNLRGFITRRGAPWSASDVFDMLPRVIDIGPALLKSEAWQKRNLLM